MSDRCFTCDQVCDFLSRYPVFDDICDCCRTYLRWLSPENNRTTWTHLLVLHHTFTGEAA